MKRRAAFRNRGSLAPAAGTRCPLGEKVPTQGRDTKLFRLRELPQSNAALLNLHAKQVLSYLEKRKLVNNAERYEVGVFLVPNRELVAMKKKFLRRNVKTVDVLAFPGSGRFPHPETRKIPLGEIYLNRRLVHADPRRGKFLLRHGLLHLLGYRHDRKSDTIRMQILEKELDRKYDTGLATNNRLGHRHRVRQGGRRGKSRRPSGA